MQINGAISLNSRVRPVKLATTEPSAETLVNVTGWGALRVNSMNHFTISFERTIYRKNRTIIAEKILVPYSRLIPLSRCLPHL